MTAAAVRRSFPAWPGLAGVRCAPTEGWGRGAQRPAGRAHLLSPPPHTGGQPSPAAPERSDASGAAARQRVPSDRADDLSRFAPLLSALPQVVRRMAAQGETFARGSRPGENDGVADLGVRSGGSARALSPPVPPRGAGLLSAADRGAAISVRRHRPVRERAPIRTAPESRSFRDGHAALDGESCPPAWDASPPRYLSPWVVISAQLRRAAAGAPARFPGARSSSTVRGPDGTPTPNKSEERLKNPPGIRARSTPWPLRASWRRPRTWRCRGRRCRSAPGRAARCGPG